MEAELRALEPLTNMTVAGVRSSFSRGIHVYRYVNWKLIREFQLQH